MAGLEEIFRGGLSLEKDVPLYMQLSGVLHRGITSGALRTGELIPSEKELCRRFGVSRNTVRQAIGVLEEQGFVLRKRGKGTYVTDPDQRRMSVPHSFTTEIISLGKTPSSSVVDFSVITPTPRLREIMRLEGGVSVYRFTRVRSVDGSPMILETSYYPRYIYPNLTRELLEVHSFYSLLHQIGVVPYSVEDSYDAVILGEREARLLLCAAGAAAFCHKRLTMTENGHIYEYTTSYMRADRVQLDVHMQKSGVSFARTID